MKVFQKEPCTAKVLRILTEADDFLTAALVVKRLPEESKDRISAAISLLYKYKAIDYIRSDQDLWWFATPETDARAFIKGRISEEGKPRPRKPGYKRTARKPRCKLT